MKGGWSYFWIHPRILQSPVAYPTLQSPVPVLSFWVPLFLLLHLDCRTRVKLSGRKLPQGQWVAVISPGTRPGPGRSTRSQEVSATSPWPSLAQPLLRAVSPRASETWLYIRFTQGAFQNPCDHRHHQLQWTAKFENHCSNKYILFKWLRNNSKAHSDSQITTTTTTKILHQGIWKKILN